MLPENAIAFTEKTAAVKKKVKNAPVEFKKRKTNMKIRRRADED